MILSSYDIEKSEFIKIDPFNDSQLNPNSYNLRLHNELVVYDKTLIDMKLDNKTSTITIPDDGMIIYPGKLYLGRTVEYTETKQFVPMLEGRSSIGRLGIFVHATAGFGDVGFKGYWTLEISCVQPVKIYPGVEICQIFYHTTDSAIENYKGKYQGNEGIQASQLYKEFE